MQRLEKYKRKHSVIGCVFGIFLSVGTIQAAEPEEIVLYDNLHVGQPRTSNPPPGQDDRLAQGFFTGEFGNVTSVSIEMRRQGMPGGQHIVEIWDDNGSAFPGKRVGILGSIELNSVPTSRSVVTFEGLVDGLKPHTPYWVYTRVPGANWNSGTYFNWHVQSDEGTYVTGDPPKITVYVFNGRWRPLNDHFSSTAYSYTRMKVTSQIPQTSHHPQPTDTATDVRRDSVLSWQPGEFTAPVDGHIVYFSETFDDVNDGIGGVTLSTESYDPGRLDLGQTYYWRVDEVAAPPESTVFEGDVWSFTTEPFSYPIANITATASGAVGASVPAKTINGSGLVDNLHGVSADDVWVSAAIPAWLQYEFDRDYKLHEMWIWNANLLVEPFVGLGAKQVVIEHSLNGTEWTVLKGITELAQGPGKEGYAANNVIDFGGTIAQYVRMTINSVHGMASQASLSEVRFLYKPLHARVPKPAKDAIEDTLDTVLSWRPGREATSHQVYLSDAMDAVLDENALIGTPVDASLDLSAQDLKYSTTYYWKVNEVNELESPPLHAGNLWHFTSPEFLSVDDMETYREEQFFEIWAHWVDGVGDPANGSIVGNENEAETDHVSEGDQSLPMLYDNGPDTVSAATRTFDPPLDWVRGDPEVLSLFFLGDPTVVRSELLNDPAPLLVVITDSAGQTIQVDYPDPAATHITSWTEWVIPIGDLGALDLAGIQAMTIGIGGDGKVAKGKMFFDSIRVGTPSPSGESGMP